MAKGHNNWEVTDNGLHWQHCLEYRVSSTDAAAAPEASVAVAAAAAAAVAAAAAALDDDECYHGIPHNLNIGYYSSSVIEYA